MKASLQAPSAGRPTRCAVRPSRVRAGLRRVVEHDCNHQRAAPQSLGGGLEAKFLPYPFFTIEIIATGFLLQSDTTL